MTTIFPPWYSRFLTLALRKLCYPTLPTDIFYHPESGWPRDQVRPRASPPDNPTTRKEKEREPVYEVNLNFPKLVSCVFLLSRASWIDTRDCLTASSFCCFDYECVSEYVERVLAGKKKSTQAKLKKHKRFLIFLCCTLLFMQGHTAWTPILILSFSVLMHTT